MKTVLLSAATLIAAATYSRAADCDLAKIESLLYPNATQGLASCANATGINIFTVSEFPTLDQVASLSENVDCADYLNQINQVANTEIQCNVTIGGVPISFGRLIADFLTGKTGNASDASSGSIEFLSESASAAKDFDSPHQDRSALHAGSSSPFDSTGSNGASSTHQISFGAYGFASVMMIAANLGQGTLLKV